MNPEVLFGAEVDKGCSLFPPQEGPVAYLVFRGDRYNWARELSVREHCELPGPFEEKRLRAEDLAFWVACERSLEKVPASAKERCGLSDQPKAQPPPDEDADFWSFLDSLILGSPPRVVAEFVPQAWINDYAVDVDPEGPTEFDVTPEISAMERTEAEAIQDGDYGSDVLRHAEAAPEWIREWSGPFRLVVQDRIKDFFASCDALAHEQRTKT